MKKEGAECRLPIFPDYFFHALTRDHVHKCVWVCIDASISKGSFTLPKVESIHANMLKIMYIYVILFLAKAARVKPSDMSLEISGMVSMAWSKIMSSISTAVISLSFF